MHTTLASAAELAARLDDPAWIIVDVRHDLAQPERWGEAQYRAAHLPGARFAHLDADLSAPKTGRNGRHPLPTPEHCVALFGRLGIEAGRQVVAYDQGSGMFASRLWWMLRWLGHDAVAVLDGGFAAWQRAGLPTTDVVPDPRPARFVPVRSAAAIAAATVDAAAIEAALAAGTLTLVDARAPERFRGEVEPLDPVAGHIPGSRNRPFAANVGADGIFKPAGVLRAEYAALLAGRPLDSVVHLCGSGVTACHNLLAMEIAGMSGSRLYAGSWSEWCADPARPVARGN
ncbi:MAG: sulfurtransferase [Betaproteobacteria bacterium]|nr:sulfurtransferase [Betaproteobacteria bacterium]